MNSLDKAVRVQQQRASRQEGIASVRPSPVLLTGEFRFVGSGENTVQVTFPMPFWEKPHTTFGFEYHSDVVNEIPATLVDGGYPEVNLGVATYVVDSDSPTRILYTGMHVLVKTRGLNNQKLIVCWHAHGMAYNGTN